MNGCSPYSSKTTEQRLHEKHAIKGRASKLEKEASREAQKHAK